MKYYKVLILLLTISLFACQSTQKIASDNKTLFTIGTEAVTADEFKYVYGKNNFNKDTIDIRKDAQEYLDLFINFKLKVKEAEYLGLHKTEEFKKEYEGYKKQLAKPYLSENKASEKLILQAYDRLQTEISASHILIRVDEKAKPEDTLRAYNKVMEFKSQIEAGKDFNAVASEFSEDSSAKSNQGKLGYFSALQMVYPFEEAAFNTEIGGVTDPVRTRFGYHLLKVHDKRPAQGTVRVSHIMLKLNRNSQPEEAEKAKAKADEIYLQLKNGGDWQALCAEFSDDTRTKATEGVLPLFSTGKMVPEFEKAAFTLKEPGDIAAPIRTAYGWHIIKLNERKGIEPFDEIKESLRTRISRDTRSQINKKAVIERLKRENNLTTNQPVLDKVVLAADSSLLDNRWNYVETNPLLNETITRIGGDNISVRSFYDFVMQNQKRKNKRVTPADFISELYNDFTDKSILEYEEAHLEEKYEDYRMLAQEYHDGILLFQLMDEKVWTKAVEDTVGLNGFFDRNRNDYQWKERARGTILNASSESILEDAKKRAIAMNDDAKALKSLEGVYNRDKPLSLQVNTGLFEKGNEAALNEADWQTGSHEFHKNNRHYSVTIDEILPSSPKKLNEIKGQVISDYQNELEAEWIEELKAKYAVVVDKKVLEKTIDEIEGNQ